MVMETGGLQVVFEPGFRKINQRSGLDAGWNDGNEGCFLQDAGFRPIENGVNLNKESTGLHAARETSSGLFQISGIPSYTTG
jgi:hypothetical protein